MKKFKFRLERVLRFRSSVTDERRRELVAANGALADAQQRLERMIDQDRTNGLPGDGLSEAHIYLREYYGIRLKNQIAVLRGQIVERERAVEEAQQRYFEAKRDERALETLKEKKKAEYLEGVAKHEQETIDELSTQRVGRALALDHIELTQASEGE